MMRDDEGTKRGQEKTQYINFCLNFPLGSVYCSAISKQLKNKEVINFGILGWKVPRIMQFFICKELIDAILKSVILGVFCKASYL